MIRRCRSSVVSMASSLITNFIWPQQKLLDLFLPQEFVQSTQLQMITSGTYSVAVYGTKTLNCCELCGERKASNCPSFNGCHKKNGTLQLSVLLWAMGLQTDPFLFLLWTAIVIEHRNSSLEWESLQIIQQYSRKPISISASGNDSLVGKH